MEITWTVDLPPCQVFEGSVACCTRFLPGEFPDGLLKNPVESLQLRGNHSVLRSQEDKLGTGLG